MKSTKWLILGSLGVAAVLVTLYVTRERSSAAPAKADTPYKEYVIQRGDFNYTVSATGTVIPIKRVQIKSKASGTIIAMPVEEGQFIQAGEFICRLDPVNMQADFDQAQADLDIAEAELKQAQNNFTRQEQLHQKGLLSDEEWDQADLGIAQARGKLVRARVNLDQAQIRLQEATVVAPSDGIILQKYVEAGQIIASGISAVSGGTTIADLADMRKVYVEAGIDEIDVGKIHVGQTVQLTFEAFPQIQFSGQIIRVAPEARIEQNVTLFDVLIEVENQDFLLKSGMNATVNITILAEKNVLLVPSTALQDSKSPRAEANEKLVLLKRNGDYVPHPIKIGSDNFSEAVVLEGLKEGDVVGVPMNSRLKEDYERMQTRFKSTRSFGK